MRLWGSGAWRSVWCPGGWGNCAIRSTRGRCGSRVDVSWKYDLRVTSYELEVAGLKSRAARSMLKASPRCGQDEAWGCDDVERKGLALQDGEDEYGVVALATATGRAANADVVVHGDFVVDVFDAEFGGAPASEADLGFEECAAHAGIVDGGTALVRGIHERQHVALDDGGTDGSVEDGASDVAEVADGVVSVDGHFERAEYLCDGGGDDEAEFGGIDGVKGFVFCESADGVFHAVDDGACDDFGDAGAGGGVVDGDEVAGAVLEGVIGEVEFVGFGTVFTGVGAAEDAATVAAVCCGLEAVFAGGFVFEGAEDDFIHEASGGGGLLLADEVEVEHEVVGFGVVVVVEGDFVVEFAGFEAEVADFEVVEGDGFFVGDVFVHFGVAEAGEAVVFALRVGDFGDEGEEAGLGLSPVVLPFGGIFGVCQVDELLGECYHGITSCELRVTNLGL